MARNTFLKNYLRDYIPQGQSEKMCELRTSFNHTRVTETQRDGCSCEISHMRD